MSAKVHNSTALESLVLQPGATFTRTRAGFDTGRRSFKCLTSAAEDLLPERGSPDSTYEGMLVDTVTQTDMRGGLTVIDVGYLGLLPGSSNANKPDTFAYATNYQEGSDTITYILDGVTYDIDFGKHLPQVTHTYVSAEMPETTVGQFIEPGRFADLVPTGVINFPGELTVTPQNPVAKWRLNGRDIREVVNLYEFTDTYNFIFKASSYSIAYF